jgi:hypothetical protein
MRRSDFVIKMTTVVLFIAITCYIGLYIFKSAQDPFQTTLAVSHTVRESGIAEGYIVRNETVLSGRGDVVSTTVTEGEKVAVGQAIAIEYEGEAALERASEIRALKLMIEQAEDAVEASSAFAVLNVEDSVIALSDAVQHQQFNNLDALSLNICKLIFKNDRTQVSEAELLELNNQLSRLMAENSGTRTIYSPGSGVFSSVVDGYESLDPASLEMLTPSSLDMLFQNPQKNEPSLGKLITGIKWYFAAVMDAPDAARLSGKPTMAVQFTKTYQANLNMKVESVGQEENGKCVVVFSSDHHMSDITALRTLTAEIVFDYYSGITVPKKAIHLDDENKTFIYLLTGLQAEQVYVNIMYEDGDNYVVEDGVTSGSVLREGSEIIVKADNLYDGKVVR